MGHINRGPAPRNSDGSNVVRFEDIVRHASKLEAARQKLEVGVSYLEELASSGVSLPPEELRIWSDTIERLRREVVEMSAGIRAHAAVVQSIADRSAARFVELEAYRREKREAAAPGLFMIARPKSVFEQYAHRYIELGYSPIPRWRNETGEHYPMRWSNYCIERAPDKLIEEWFRIPDAMIALCCGNGGLTVFDVDTEHTEQQDAILEALPDFNIGRRGSKAFALFTRYEKPEKFFNIYTGPREESVKAVEIKGLGQNITVPPSLHFKTGNPYFLFVPSNGDPLEEMPRLDELPQMTDYHLEQLKEAMAPWATPPRPPPPPRPGFDPNKVDKSRYGAWYRKALTNNASDLASMSEGRPTKLFNASCAIGAGVHLGFLSRSEFEGALLSACEKNGLAARVGSYAILDSISRGLHRAVGDELPDLGEIKPRRLGKRRKLNGHENGSGDGGGASGPQSEDPEDPKPEDLKPDPEKSKSKLEWPDRGSKGAIQLTSIANVKAALDHLGIRAWQNDFTCIPEIEGGAGRQVMDDHGITEVWRRVNALGLFATDAFVAKAWKAIAKGDRRHPIRDWLDGLTWDRTSRAERLFIDYAGAPDTPYNRALGVLLLVAMVRRIRQPGYKFDHVILLRGPQDLAKSLFWQVLASPAYFSDNFDFSLSSKEIIEQTARKWLVEAGEMKGLTPKQIGHIRAVITRQVDSARLAYGVGMAGDFPRQFVVVGTVNEYAFLHDQHGNRRFDIIDVTKIDIEALARDREQIFAEMNELERTYGWLVLPDAVKADAKEMQDAALVRDHHADDINDALDGRYGFVSRDDIYTHVLFVGKDHPKRNDREIARVVKETVSRAGWKETQLNDASRARGYGRVGANGEGKEGRKGRDDDGPLRWIRVVINSLKDVKDDKNGD